MIIDLISFAGPGIGWQATAKRFIREAQETQIFSRIKVYRADDLVGLVPPLSISEAKLIETVPRGYGNWVWKPAVIEDYLNTAPSEAEMVLYCDVGFSFGDKNFAQASFSKLKPQLSSIGPTFFSQPGFPDIFWSRRSVIELFRDNGIIEAAFEGQLYGGVHFWKNDDQSRIVVSDWRNLCRTSPSEYLLDPHESSQELEGFIAHRHDQSLISFIGKKSGAGVVSGESLVVTGSKEHLKPWRFEEKAKIRGSFFSVTRVRSRFSSKDTKLSATLILIAERIIYDLELWIRRVRSKTSSSN